MKHPRSRLSVILEIIIYELYFNIILIPSLLWSFLSALLPSRSKNISGQLALITGGSAGIGRAIAFRLAKEGCNIAIANRNHENGQKVAEEIRKKFNVEAKAFQCNVANREDVRKLKNEVKKSFGTVDLLINNAGLMPMEHSLLEGDDEAYQNCVDVNFTSYIWTTRAFLPDMIKQRRGHIVGISSILIQCPSNFAVTYIATKFANKGFIDGLREDMCIYGFNDFIKTTTVLSGFVKTNDNLVELLDDIFLPIVLYSKPVDAADRIVNGILKNKENIYASWFETYYMFLVSHLSRSVKTRVLKNTIRSDIRDEYIAMRLKKCELENADADLGSV